LRCSASWLTLVDVSGRKLLSTSVTGSLELTELLLVVVIFAGLPLVSAAWRACGVRLARPLMPPWLRRVQQAWSTCSARRAGRGLADVDQGRQMIEYGDTTAQLKLPLGPFVYVMSVLCAVTAFVHLAADRAARRTSPPPGRPDDLDALTEALLGLPPSSCWRCCACRWPSRWGWSASSAWACCAAGRPPWPTRRRWSTTPASPTR
jgi:hypothetical protein